MKAKLSTRTINVYEVDGSKELAKHIQKKIDRKDGVLLCVQSKIGEQYFIRCISYNLTQHEIAEIDEVLLGVACSG